MPGVGDVQRVEQLVHAHVRGLVGGEPHSRIIGVEQFPQLVFVLLVDITAVADEYEAVHLRNHAAHQLDGLFEVDRGVEQCQIVFPAQLPERNALGVRDGPLADIVLVGADEILLGADDRRDAFSPLLFGEVPHDEGRGADVYQHPGRILAVFTGEIRPEIVQIRLLVHQERVHMLDVYFEVFDLLYRGGDVGDYLPSPRGRFVVAVDYQYVITFVSRRAAGGVGERMSQQASENHDPEQRLKRQSERFFQ